MNVGLSVIVQTLNLLRQTRVIVGCLSTLLRARNKVSDTLRGMVLSVEDEFRCPKSGYSIDIRYTTCVSMKSTV